MTKTTDELCAKLDDHFLQIKFAQIAIKQHSRKAERLKGILLKTHTINCSGNEHSPGCFMHKEKMEIE